MKQNDDSAPAGCAGDHPVTDWFGRKEEKLGPGDAQGGGKTSHPRAPGQAPPHPAPPGGERGHRPVAQPPHHPAVPRREAELSHGEAAGEVFISDWQRFNRLRPDKVPLIVTPEGNWALSAADPGAGSEPSSVSIPVVWCFQGGFYPRCRARSTTAGPYLS